MYVLKWEIYIYIYVIMSQNICMWKEIESSYKQNLHIQYVNGECVYVSVTIYKYEREMEICASEDLCMWKENILMWEHQNGLYGLLYQMLYLKLYPAFIFQLICCFHLNASKIALQPNFLTF